MEYTNNLLGVFKTLYRRRRPIIIISAVAGIGTALLSLTLPNFYKAKTTFLAASPDQARPELVFSSGNMRVNYYGTDTDLDRVLTIAESNELIMALVDSFGLYEHYDINPEAAKAEHRVRSHFKDLYEVIKTKRDAIALSLEDRDPELSANMANTARHLIDQMTRELIKNGLKRTMATYNQVIQTKELQLQELGDSLVVLRKHFGIYNTESQTELLSQQLAETSAKLVRNEARLNTLKGSRGIPRDTISYLHAEVEGMKIEVDTLERRLDRLNQGMATVGILEKAYLEANQQLGEDREKAKQVKAILESDIPALILIEAADVPTVKSRPRRSILVLAAGAIAFIFSCLGVLLFESTKTINWRQVLDD